MSFDIQSALTQLQLNNYGSLVIIVAVSYDYCLTLSKEINYIWKRPWTWVSTLFLLIRYGGYVSVITFALFFTTFIPDPARVCNIIYLLGTWAYPLFWVGADMVMILRVYAMYNRSGIVFGVLIVICVAEVVILFISSSFYSSPKYATVSAMPLLDSTICYLEFNTQTWNNAGTVIQCILAAVLYIFVVAQFVRESLQMYRATQNWRLNRYMSLLVRDGLIYFLVTVFYTLVALLGMLGFIPTGWATPALKAAINIPLYTLTPRFVMNVRELYALNMQGGCARDIDTGFGYSSAVERGTGGSRPAGTLAFEEDGGNGGLDGEVMNITEERR